ncbi:MAG: XdhC family protein [Verrucomicrobia bacterium]|nr:XdhC family protein [Verrucomicrobiota bacterium]
MNASSPAPEPPPGKTTGPLGGGRQAAGLGAPTSQDLPRAVLAWCDAGRPFALALVLETSGSTPAKAGAHAILDATGAIFGTIGGGLVEAETQQHARAVIAAGRPMVLDRRLQGSGVADADPICGGRMRVLIDPTAVCHRAAFAAAAGAQQRRERGVLLTTLHSSAELTVATDVAFVGGPTFEPPPGTVRADVVRTALETGQTGLVVVESASGGPPQEVLVEPLVPRPRLLIVGAGHVGQAVAVQANLVGFDIAVLDDRAAFLTPALWPPDATLRCGDIPSELAAGPLDPDTYVVLVTRGHRHDAAALAVCLHQPTAYVGMIGSRRKVALVRQEFLESGRATAAEFDRVCAPIGLELGAVTVPEIATSIVAQLILTRRKGRDGKTRPP